MNLNQYNNYMSEQKKKNANIDKKLKNYYTKEEVEQKILEILNKKGIVEKNQLEA